jgi:type VI protein secretion system component VasA
MAKPQSPTELMWSAMAAVLRRGIDMSSWQNSRIAALEERLAALDNGDDAEAARRRALDKVNAERITEGVDELTFRIVGRGAEQRLKWDKEALFRK